MALASLIVSVVALCGGSVGHLPHQPAHEATKLEVLAQSVRAKHALKGLVLAVVTRDGLGEIAASGMRAEGSTDAITTSDRMHLGSCTKAFTATLVATLVADGTLRWDSTVGEVLGANTPSMHEEWKAVTIEELLRHRGGAPGSADAGDWSRAWNCSDAPEKCRAAFVDAMLARPLAQPRGTHVYSNQGFAIAGRMCEVALNAPYETVLAQRVLTPLGINDFGFGVPSRANAASPKGHAANGSINDGDNPQSIAPAGTLHMPVGEWAKFVAFQLGGTPPKQLEGAAKLLEHLQLPSESPQHEALGWFALERPWGGVAGNGTVLTHSGSNTLWYCVAWLAPLRGFAVLAATNQGGDAMARACDEACASMIGSYAKSAQAVKPDEAARAALAELRRADIEWKSPSSNASGSMPIGNGTLGANVWVEDNGDLLLLLSHTDAFSEAERLLKLGRVRISCDPPLDLTNFAQRMQFESGAIAIHTGGAGDSADLTVFADAESPAMRVLYRSDKPRTVKAALECWRESEHVLTGAQLKSSWIMRDAPASVEVKESADVVLPIERASDAVVWFHRNEWSVVPTTLTHQSLDSVKDAFADPLLDRTFGGRIDASNFERSADRAMTSKSPVTAADIVITTACAQTASSDEWVNALAASAAAAPRGAVAQARTATLWQARFAKSWIYVDAPKSAANISQALAAQRAVSLAATSGEFPVKFNGSIFTVAPKFVSGAEFNEDFRNWGGDYWWQNTRLAYHGMLERGDGDHMKSLFDFYFNALAGCRARAKLYHGVEGAYFPETMTTFATYGNGDYGWNREGVAPSVVQCPYWQWAWNQGPELVAMMLDHYDFTGDEATLRERTLPIARAVLEYFDSRFSRDIAGLMQISPTQSAETYWSGVVNDLPSVVGLREITMRLCALPSSMGDATERALWERVRAACPAVPLTEDGTRFAAAQTFDAQRNNCENPELYAVWPFRAASVCGSSLGYGIANGLAIGRASFAARIERMTHGWTQDGMQAARLGLADEAAANVLAKVGNSHANFRYPIMWGPNFDWLPDQCHGGNLLTTVELMLVQSAGEKIMVLPAWPKDWNARFRLHAPCLTTVTGEVRDGKLVSLVTDPPSRLKDVALGEGWTMPTVE